MSLFFRHLMSYIVVFVIPLLILGFYAYSHFTAVVTDNFNQSKEEAMNLIRDQLNLKMADVLNISQQLSKNSDLKPHTMNTFNGFYFSVERLNYPSANSFFYDIYYYVRGGDYLFSSSGTYRVPLFINQMYRYEKLDVDEFSDLINHSREVIVRGSEQVITYNQSVKHFLTIIVPIPLNSSNPYGTAIFQVEEKKLRDMLRSIINYPDGDVLIHNKQGELLLTLTDRSREASQEIWKYVNANADQSNLELTIDGTEFLVTSVHSEQTQWRFTVLTPKSYLLGPIQAIQTQYLQVFTVILIVGSLAIYFLMYLNYNPLQKLISYVEEIWTVHHDRKYSGLDSVYEAIRELGSASYKLTEQINKSREAVIQYCFLQIMRGIEEETAEAIARLKEFGYQVSDSRYYVTVAELEEQQGNDLPAVQRVVSDRLTNQILKYSDTLRIEIADPRLLVWVTPFETEEKLRMWEIALSEVVQELQIDITIGIGKPVNELSQISKSYMQAHNAVQHKILLGINKVIYFKDIQSEPHEIDIKPLHQIESLKSFIREGYPDKLADLASNISDEIERASPNLFVAKCLALEVLQNVVREMKRAAPGYILHHPDILTLSNYNRMMDVRIAVESIIHHAAQHLSKMLDHTDMKLQRMLQFLDDNITNPQFSLQHVADHFNCSIKHANQYFKKHMKISIIEYVHHQRLEKVKQLLHRQDLRIQDIIESVGYHDSSSFIRKFKKIVGCTPGEYRKIILQSDSNPITVSE